jgi:hypothetical protein
MPLAGMACDARLCFANTCEWHRTAGSQTQHPPRKETQHAGATPQWHPEIDKEFGETAGQSFQTMLEHDAHERGITLADIRAWKPEPRNTRTTRKRNGESS